MWEKTLRIIILFWCYLILRGMQWQALAVQSKIFLLGLHRQREDYSEFKMFVDNFDEFDHVLIFESRKEDVFDQLFRLFRAYE